MIDYIKHYAVGGCCKKKTCGNDQTLTRADEPRYDVLDLTDDNILRYDNTGDYTPQGGCTDGEFLYRALVKADEEPTKLQKINMETGAIVLEVVDTSYGHANDMTYNAKDDYLYIAHSSSTSTVYKVDKNTLQLVDTLNFGPAIWGIEHEGTNNLYLLGNVGAAYLSVYNNSKGKPEFMYRIKPQNAFTGAVRQGIACDDNYIYVALDNAYGAVIENEKGSRIAVYTWNGMFIKSILVNIAEIEFLAVKDKTFYIGTYEGRDEKNKKSGYIYKVDYDMYPEQTVLTGRPTDVSGGLNNLQRLPEGTMVRLFNSNGLSAGTLTLDTANTQLKVDEDGPFRYFKVRYKGANANVVDWFPVNNGVLTLREFDVTAAVNDSTVRFREMRAIFNAAAQTFTIDSNFVEDLFSDVSEGTLQLIKDNTGTRADLLVIEQIWGVV